MPSAVVPHDAARAFMVVGERIRWTLTGTQKVGDPDSESQGHRHYRLRWAIESGVQVMHNVSRVIGLAISPLVLSLVAGCNTFSPLVERRITLEFPPAQALVSIGTSNGAISVGPGTDDKIVVNALIRARTQERADATTVTATVDAQGVLQIAPQWPGERMGNEGCSLDVAMTSVSELTLVTSNGGLTVNGLGGVLKARTSNGAIKVDGFTGSIDGTTSNGSVTIVGATHGVGVRTSNGGVKVTMAPTSPGPVAIATSNGSIDLSVGQSFAGSLQASTSNGSVSIAAPGATDVQVKKGSGSARFGDGQGSSSLQSSNGSITVRGQ